MKAKKIPPFLTLLAVLAMLISIFPAIVPVSAASGPYLELSRTAGVAGADINIRGYHFSTGDYYYIFFGEKYLGRGVINDDSEFTRSVTIPDGTSPGNYVITAGTTGDDLNGPYLDYDYDETVTIDFLVKDISIKLNSDSGPVSDAIEINGSGFTKDYYYYIFFDEIYRASGTVDADGKLTKSIPTPSKPTGFYEIAVMASQSSKGNPSYSADYAESATAQYEIVIEASIAIDKVSGNVGDTFKLTGNSFNANKTITVYWDKTKIGSTFTASSSGTFEDEAFTVPETSSGSHTIKVMDTSRTFGAVSYSVAPKISLSSASIISGNIVTVNGTGFKASSTLTFYVDDTVLSPSGSSSALGTLGHTSLTVSVGSAGNHVFKVKDDSGNAASANINVSVPTPAPTPTPTPTQTSTTSITATSATTSTSTTTSTPTTTHVTNTPQPSNTPTPTGFPVWAIVAIIVSVIIIVAVVVFLARLPKTKK
jgi:hypothetical protein